MALVENFSINMAMADRFQHLYPHHDPLISPLTVNWHKARCSYLKITFKAQIKQPTNLSGRKLKDYLRSTLAIRRHRERRQLFISMLVKTNIGVTRILSKNAGRDMQVYCKRWEG